MTCITFIACKDDVALPELTAEEYPRILGKWPEKTGNNLGVLGATVGETFKLDMQYTPSQLCVGTWFVNDVEYSKGTAFRYDATEPALLRLKLVVTTPKYTTTREAMLEFKRK
jgi:hypothetical protein